MEISSMFIMWQALALSCILTWVWASSMLDLTRRVRSLTQPWVTRRVISDIAFILKIQSGHNRYLDNLFTAISCIVSVPFYTGFLTLVYWSGHYKLSRQLTLLMAFCDYIGNSIKDLVSAPRPSCPPARRVTATQDEKENAMEYGLPSTHALNTICLAGYLLDNILTNSFERDVTTKWIGFGLLFILVGLIGISRIYLGMHSLIDVVAGIVIGIVILAFWLNVDEYIDEFIISGKNVTLFWTGLSFLLCFAYPTPESPSPSFEFHTAFNGVAFGLVIGIQQTRSQINSENVRYLFSSEIPLPLHVFVERMMVGLAAVLTVKFFTKNLAKWLLPLFCTTLGIPVYSTSYVPALVDSDCSKKKHGTKQSGFLSKFVLFVPQETFNVDTGIRFLQYAGLSWSTVDIVPQIFTFLNL